MLPRKRDIAKAAKGGADPKRCPKHLSFIRRNYVCAAFRSGECEGKNHAHHVRSAATSGTGVKPPDWDTVPLCNKHHDELHLIGVETFEAKYGVNLLAEARKLARVSPHLKRRAA